MSDNDDDVRVREAIEAIALNPSSVGLTHAKILRDEIVRLRSRVAELVREAADVRVRLRGYPDSRLDGDGGLAAAVMREYEAQVAALVAQLGNALVFIDGGDVPFDGARDAHRTFRDAAAAANAHNARVRREALEEAARECERMRSDECEPEREAAYDSYAHCAELVRALAKENG